MQRFDLSDADPGDECPRGPEVKFTEPDQQDEVFLADLRKMHNDSANRAFDAADTVRVTPAELGFEYVSEDEQHQVEIQKLSTSNFKLQKQVAEVTSQHTKLFNTMKVIQRMATEATR